MVSSLIPDTKVKIKLIKHEIRRYLIIRFDKCCENKGIKMEVLSEEIMIGLKSTQLSLILALICDEFGFPKLAQRIKVSNCPLKYTSLESKNGDHAR